MTFDESGLLREGLVYYNLLKPWKSVLTSWDTSKVFPVFKLIMFWSVTSDFKCTRKWPFTKIDG